MPYEEWAIFSRDGVTVRLWVAPLAMCVLAACRAGSGAPPAAKPDVVASHREVTKTSLPTCDDGRKGEVSTEYPGGADCPPEAVFWPRACYLRQWARFDAPSRVWTPPSGCPQPRRDASDVERHQALALGQAYSELSPWSSSDAWPEGLVLALVRAGPIEYAVNIYSDGGVRVQLLRCPSTSLEHANVLDPQQLHALMDLFAQAHFLDLPACNPPVSDSYVFALGLSLGDRRRVVYSTDGSIAFPSWQLARAVDRVVGLRDWGYEGTFGTSAGPADMAPR
jgi:hypothetical protein